MSSRLQHLHVSFDSIRSQESLLDEFIRIGAGFLERGAPVSLMGMSKTYSLYAWTVDNLPSSQVISTSWRTSLPCRSLLEWILMPRC